MPLFQSSILKKYSAAGFPAFPEAVNKECESCIYPADLGGHIHKRWVYK